MKRKTIWNYKKDTYIVEWFEEEEEENQAKKKIKKKVQVTRTTKVYN